MANERRAVAGDVVAWLIRCIPVAVWTPIDLPQGDALNPFREPKPVSEAMRKHLEMWNRRKWRAVTGG